MARPYLSKAWIFQWQQKMAGKIDLASLDQQNCQLARERSTLTSVREILVVYYHYDDR
jgi:hypothetical protein